MAWELLVSRHDLSVLLRRVTSQQLEEGDRVSAAARLLGPAHGQLAW